MHVRQEFFPISFEWRKWQKAVVPTGLSLSQRSHELSSQEIQNVTGSLIEFIQIMKIFDRCVFRSP